jgi:hypothetical protein
MGQSYRIRTELGINKTINVSLDQDFEFLEVLSLQIQQTDVYNRSCAEYGVVVGRVTANNGFGLPNARVSVFIPITTEDQSNPIISSIYPYKSPEDKNEDGFRYNLLPYEKSYSTHAATGTLPSRLDALTDSTVVEIFDKYYKLTAKTNESGDYMIMGVPIGTRSLVMDVDLSDIGEFSLSPQDLIRMGLATENQVAGNRFRISNDLNSLPQIINLRKDIDVLPLWGDPTVCQLAITRTDFDLRDDANVDIQPTSVFMGSIYSSPDKFRVRPGFRIGPITVGGCKPKDNLGNLCELTSGPGQIIAIRQTIFQDSDGNPVLEQYQLEQSGNVIDGDGTWLVELPMNLDYLITNEFGERTISSDPSIGIPTSSKYRLKIKWQQPTSLTEQTRRGYFLVPNVKEYGWFGNEDPNFDRSNTPSKRRLSSSYYFGLDWSGYTDGFSGQQKIDKLNESINCEDTFYEFRFNRVYTVSGLIDQWKKGAKGRFIGIKEIDDDSCSGSINKFPVNDGFRNFDFLFFLFSILLQVVQLVGIPLLISYHLIAFLWNSFAVPLTIFLIGFFIKNAINFWSLFIGAVTGSAVFGATAGQIAGFLAQSLLYSAASIFIATKFRLISNFRFGKLKIPMITYPTCQACECEPDTSDLSGSVTESSLLTQFSNMGLYYDNILSNINVTNEDEKSVYAIIVSEAIAGRSSSDKAISTYKTTKSSESVNPETERNVGAISTSLPMGERINIFNSRKNYFDGNNRISVSFNFNSNIGKNHFDNTVTVLSNSQLEPGQLVSFVSLEKSEDLNFKFTAETNSNIINGITGTPKNIQGQISVVYANRDNQTQGDTQTYTINSGTTIENYRFPTDIEYYQVLTAITVSDFIQLSSTSNVQNFSSILLSCSNVSVYRGTTRRNSPRRFEFSTNICTKDVFTEFDSQYVVIFQRGVDPYSPIIPNKYGLGKLFGFNDEDSITITATTRLNVPIQPIQSGLAIQQHNNQNNIFFPSYFWESGNGFSSFTTSNVGYYSAFDANYPTFTSNQTNLNGLTGVSTKTSNSSYSNNPSAQFYDLSEDLSGVGIYYTNNNGPYNNFNPTYLSPSLLPSLTANPITISSKIKNVMRTDRLPSSDFMDGSGWDKNAFVLQQNLGFALYLINTDSESITTDAYSTGADVVIADIEGQIYEGKVLESFTDCGSLVSLKCYEGFGSNFGINEDCRKTDSVQNGCYVLVKRPLLDLGKDLKAWSEWGYRFRFFFGLCRGVLSQSFMNNWVNGSLYAFPIEVDTFYDRQNNPSSKFCQDLIYFDDKTTNFYYRSSPYNDLTNKFIGKPASEDLGALNKRNLLFPTTIINLGMKDSFYGEISFEPSTRAYVMSDLDSTSYGDTSDLINLFVISRITDASFLGQILNAGDNSLNQLFTRKDRRIDGDLAQLMSINSELGVVKFSPEYYEIQPNGQNNPTNVLGTPKNPTIAVWFSSTTENLQTKDYLTPGRIDFRATPTSNFSPFNFGIKTQVVPFYKWQLNEGTTIFGTQQNNWLTDTNNIVSVGYQSQDRMKLANPTYFQSSTSPNTTDLNNRGYIFSVDGNGNYSPVAALNKNFIVGAPFHFYFGIVKGQSALDKFKTKYSVIE